jgi:hypothetical protein
LAPIALLHYEKKSKRVGGGGCIVAGVIQGIKHSRWHVSALRPTAEGLLLKPRSARSMLRR